MRLSPLHRFPQDQRGGAAILFALALPMLVPAAGAAVEYSRMTGVASRLQKAADAAAVATTRELNVANAGDETRFRSVARSVANASLGLPQLDESLTIEPTPTANRSGFTVRIAQAFTPTGVGGWLLGGRTLSASATAQRKGAGKLCVLALSLKKIDEKDAIKLEEKAEILGQNCAAFANSASPEAITMRSTTTLSGSLVCSAGGIRRESGAQILAETMTDCPKVDNPLADRPAPVPGRCLNPLDKDGKVIPLRITKSQDLLAGTYCGGVEIDGKDTVVTLRPDGGNDVVIILDGELRVKGDATLTGRGVGVAFSGRSASFKFEGQSTIDLEAPTSGPLAGVLFYGSLDAPDFTDYVITSNNARNLVGTIYVPTGTFKVDAENKVADLSAYTAIVVTRIHLKGSPKLTLNTNYFQTKVPVAKGIASFGGSINLTQ